MTLSGHPSFRYHLFLGSGYFFGAPGSSSATKIIGTLSPALWWFSPNNRVRDGTVLPRFRAPVVWIQEGHTLHFGGIEGFLHVSYFLVSGLGENPFFPSPHRILWGPWYFLGDPYPSCPSEMHMY